MIDFKQEFIDEVEGEIIALGELHMAEVHHQHEILPVDFDLDLYKKAEGLGLLKIFTARDQGELIGYVVVVITPDIHSKGRFLASDDGFFVKREYRKQGHGIRLLQFTENCLKQDGFATFHVSSTAMNPIDDLLLRVGYNEIERKYEKVL